MTANERPEASTADGPTRSWRTADIPAAVLILGLLLVGAATLALASLGSAVGIAAVGVLLAGVVGLLWFWGREQLRSKP